MSFRLLFVFFLLDEVRSFEYDASNQQRCTAKPFAVPSPHNCSRSRIRSSVTKPNDDLRVPITIIFGHTTNTNLSIIVRKSPMYRQLNLTITSIFPRTVLLNNRLPINLNQTKVLSYLYDSTNEAFTRKNNLSIHRMLTLRNMCELKVLLITPLAESTRIYFLYTDENYLEIDLNRWATDLSPVLSVFENCVIYKNTIESKGIALIVIVSVLSFMTAVLNLFWLKRQIKQIYYIWKQWFRTRLGLTPEIYVDDQSYMMNANNS